MKSEITLQLTDNRLVLPSAPDEGVLLKSGDLWTGIKIEHHHLSGMHLPQHVVNQHRLLINIGKPVAFEWRSDGVWNRKVYGSGDFALQSHGEVNEPRWNDQFSFLAVALDPQFVNQQADLHDFMFSEKRGESDPVIKELSLLLLNELKQPHFAGKIFGDSLAIAYAIHLVSNYGSASKKIYAPKGKLPAVQLKRILEYSKEFLHSNIGLDELASLVNLSSFHFTRLFKLTTGMAPHQFLLRLKLERARQLMIQKKLSLTEISYELGFNDQAHFSNAFKRHTGIAPRKFMSL